MTMRHFRFSIWVGPTLVEEIGQCIKGLGRDVIIGTEALHIQSQQQVPGDQSLRTWSAVEEREKLDLCDQLKAKFGTDFGLNHRIR